MKNSVSTLRKKSLSASLKVSSQLGTGQFFTVSYCRGLRAAEPGQLKLSDWDRKAQRLFVHRGKGSVSGQALLSPTESRTLEAWIRVRGLMALLYALRIDSDGDLLHVLVRRL